MLLINWLYYEKTILNFEDIVFLSGKTGEGKSALIDAMQLVILGRCDNSIFNKSANDKTTRDLMGYLKGKSALMIFDRHANLKYKYGSRHFWAKGYFCDTVGKNEKIIREYIQNQLQEDKLYDQMSMREFIDPFTGEPVKGGKK